MDRVTAAKHSIAGQGLAKTVCKATTEEVMGPKKKHLDCKCQWSYCGRNADTAALCLLHWLAKLCCLV